MNFFDCVKNENILVKPQEHITFLAGASLDAAGENYYDFQKTITTNYTCVICADSGVVRYITDDASTISPGVGERVFGIDDYPAEITFDGTWKFDTETAEFYQDADVVAAQTLRSNTLKYNHLLRTAGAAHMLLQLLPPDDAAEKLQALKDYLGALQTLDFSRSDLVWPDVPAFINSSEVIL